MLNGDYGDAGMDLYRRRRDGASNYDKCHGKNEKKAHILPVHKVELEQ
jgi:hypothetical protein